MTSLVRQQFRKFILEGRPSAESVGVYRPWSVERRIARVPEEVNGGRSGSKCGVGADLCLPRHAGGQGAKVGNALKTQTGVAGTTDSPHPGAHIQKFIQSHPEEADQG
jgi:hypothetical protein